MNVLLTNRINVIGVFLSTFFYTFINSWVNYPATFLQALFGAFLLVCLYGIIFWIGFLLALIILDSVLIVPNQKKIILKLLLEWAIISSPIIYWAVIYEEQRWLYIVAIIAFLITQLLREKSINKITR